MTVEELKSQYSSVKKIKRGGQKTVYKALDTQGASVALKIINDSSDPRVLQEIALVRQLALANTPNIIDSGIALDKAVQENVLYIVEEFISGTSLRDWINNGNKFDLKQAYDVLTTLLNVEILLEDAHILHRDINPNNIILADDGKVYLIDFGLAKNLNGPSYTRTAAAMGPFTPGYAPHEQFANIKLAQDVRTDLFQIGVTIYEGCDGKNPFIEPNETIYQIMSRTMTMLPPMLNLSGDTKGMFGQFVGMLMAKNQSQRPDTARDAMRYLNAIKSTLVLEG